jgi:hypothetical protein
MPYDRTYPEFVYEPMPISDDATVQPTCALRWNGGVLEQAFLITSKSGARSEWRAVPQALEK